MKKIALTLITVGFAVQTFAGPYIAPKQPQVVDPYCPCFNPGWQYGAFAAGMWGPDSLGNEYAGNPTAGSPAAQGDDAIGAGVSLSYFFTQRIGVEYSYAWQATRSDRHQHTVDFIYRHPLGYSCFAPYVIGGGGVFTNGGSKGIYRVGGGIEYRMERFNCASIFTDYTYNWVAGGDSGWDNGYNQARVGMRLSF